MLYVHTFCLFQRIEDQMFSTVKSSELDDYTIVVTTTITARMLWLNGVKKGYFTHILVDEAAQVCVSVSQSVCLSVCLSVSLSVCL